MWQSSMFISLRSTYNACFVKENQFVGIKNADFGFELLSKIITSLKGNLLYL